MITFEADRIRANTSPEILEKIDSETEQRVRFYATQSNGAISNRLMELEKEWDIERLLHTNASGLALTGLLLGITKNSKWLFLTGGVLALLMQHAIQGWSLPIPVLRRMGIRTRTEIEREKFALKALRGDFERIPERTDANDILRAHDALRAAAY